MKTLLCLSFLVLVGCKKTDAPPAAAEAPEKTAVKDLGASGFVVDAPESWTVEEPMKGFYTVKAGRGRGFVQLRETAAAVPADVEALKKTLCEGQSDVQSGAIGEGGFWATCKGPAKAMQIEGQELTTTKIEAWVPAGEGKALMCGLETDKDPGAILAICKSMRKK